MSASSPAPAPPARLEPQAVSGPPRHTGHGRLVRRLGGPQDARSAMGGAAVMVAAVIFCLAAVNEYQLTVGINVGISAIAALGLTVVAGRAGQLALGQAGFMAVGAYVVAYTTLNWGWPFLVALVAGTVLAFVLGLLLGWIALRLEGNYLAMATLAFGAIIFGVLLIDTPLGGASGLFGIPGISPFGSELGSPLARYVFVWIVVGLALLVCWRFARGRAGQELAAMRDDALTATTLGVNITHRKIQAFALSAILGGVAGGIMAANEQVIDPTLFRPLISFQIFLMIVIGGLGSLGGAVAGAALVTWLVELVPGTGDSAYVALGVVVVVFMAFFPGGLAALATSALRRVGRDPGGPRPEDRP